MHRRSLMAFAALLCLFLSSATAPVFAREADNPQIVADCGNTGDDLPCTNEKIEIVGNKVLRNGKHFIVKGVIFEGFIDTLPMLEKCIAQQPEKAAYCDRHLDSRNYYFGRGNYADGKDALTLAVRNWNANTVRFNIDQDALNPSSARYTASYFEEIKSLVREARKRGLVVVLALFNHRIRNAPEMMQGTNYPLNTAETLNGALLFAREFGRDEGVMIELLNEPWSPTNRRVGWRLWRDGGVVDNPRSRHHGLHIIGGQQIVNEIRATGARNAIIVQGLRASFVGMPSLITDPLNKIIYSVHPLFRSAESQSEAEWERRFGAFALEHPVVLTAWNARGGDKWCEVSGIGAADRFIAYVKKLGIGLIGYAFDIRGTMTKDFQKYLDEPATLETGCRVGNHAGGLIRDLFRSANP